MEFFRVRKPSIVEPELLIETDDIGDQRVSIPSGDCTPVVERIVVVSASLTNLLSPVGIHNAFIAIAAAHQDEDAFVFLVLHKLNTVNLLKLTGSARGFATLKHWI